MKIHCGLSSTDVFIYVPYVIYAQVVEAMKELGMDLSDRKPIKLTDELAQGATLLVTMFVAYPICSVVITCVTCMDACHSL